MSERSHPGLSIEEIERGPRPIEGVATATTGLVGQTERGPATPQLVTSVAEYERQFGGFLDPSKQGYLPHAVSGFFRNGGTRAFIARTCAARGQPYDLAAYLGAAPDPARPESWSGLKALEAVDEVAMLCVPDQPLLDERYGGAMTMALVAQCERLRSRICLLQSRAHEPDAKAGLHPATDSSFAAFYYPWITASDPAGGAATPAPAIGHYCRHVRTQRCGAGRLEGARRTGARPDDRRSRADGAGDESPPGKSQFARRQLPAALSRGGRRLIWGARTAAAQGDYKYVPVRRLSIFIERSIDRGTQWVVFEPNAPSAWTSVIRLASEFLTALWRNGALVGRRPQEVFFAKCDRTTMTQEDIDNGRLIVEIGFAPVRPAEFVVIRIGQWTQEAKCS